MKARSNKKHSGFDTQTETGFGTSGSAATCSREDLRSEERTSVEAKCKLYFFDGPQATITEVSGVARNLSFSGVAVVSEIADAVRIGQAVEVVVMRPEAQPTHVAGTIAFCKKIDFGKFEIGVHVQAAGQSPILIHDVEESLKQYEWFADSLQPSR